MNKKNKMRLAIALVSTGIFCIFFLTGCHTLKNMANQTSSQGPEKNVKGIESKDFTQFTSTIRPYRGDANSTYRLACYFQERKKYSLAVEEFKKAIRIDPTHAKAYNGLGVSYDKLGEFSLAVQAYKTALVLNPDLDYVQNNLGYSYLLQGDLGSAIEAFQNAVALNNGNKRYHNNLGLAYAKNGLFDLAFSEFRLASDETKAHYHMAQFYYQQGLYEEARIHFAKASTLNPDDTDTRKGLAASENLARISPSKTEQIAEPSPPPISAETHKAFSQEKEGTEPFAGVKVVEKNEKQQDSGIERPFTDVKVVEKNIEQWDSVIEIPVNKNATTARPLMLANIAIQDSIKPGAPDNEFDEKRPCTLSHISLEISNGNGVRHMARRVGQYLGEQGFNKPYLTNANHFNHPETMIYYRSGYLQDAYRVAKEIPGYQDMKKVARFQRPSTTVRVLIGRDMIPIASLFTNRDRIS
jgi:tetratricopeptide (TPR) repeat protein